MRKFSLYVEKKKFFNLIYFIKNKWEQFLIY